MRLRYVPVLAVLLFAAQFILGRSTPQNPPLRFEVTTNLAPASGRLFIVISRNQRPEPRTTIGETGLDAPPVLGRDVKSLDPGGAATIDKTAVIFPIASLDALSPGDYYVQALFDSNVDLSSVNAPGNRYSEVERVHLDPRSGGTIKLSLTKTVPPEQLPPDDQYVKYVKIQSNLLSRFHGRPIFLRAGVILPKNYGNGNRRYPLRIHIGGYGTRYSAVQRLMAPNSEFHRMWLDEDTPRFIYIQLDGDGPNGDSYQVNSDNNGPYGDAITRELIPYIEQKFQGVGEPYARVLDGESTGGWVSLALKVFYPDFFNAVWSSCPDGVDFRGFQLIDIYSDKNAYFDDHGAERPSKRDINGRVEFSIRHECQMENVMGAGDSWTMSGQQWGAWNATYGPRGADSRPVPLWDAKSGVIDRSVVDHWKNYDLRTIIEKNWKTLGPKLRGKIHISVGEADNYYLNNAVHMLDEFFKKADPPADARIAFGPGRGHCWSSVSETQMMNEMAQAVEQSSPHLPRWQEQRSGTGARLRGVSAVDENVVWASGANGTVVRTVDGGTNWSASVVPGASDLDFRDVHAVDGKTAYLLSIGEGEKSRIYKTTDGGGRWALQFTNHDPHGFFDGFAFWDANNGIAFSDPVEGRFLIVRTSDGGANWSETRRADMPPALPDEAAFAASGTSITVAGPDHVWIATGGSAARVFHSSDRGATWSVANTPIGSGAPSAGIFSIYALSPQSIFIVGGDYQKEKESSLNFARSADAGSTWLAGPRLPGYRSAINVAAGDGASVYIAVGPSGTGFIRPDGGPWINTGTTGYDAVSFAPGRPTGWAVGQGGRIAKWQGLPK
jgi:photosystem II stability/assembly factor-like uncharacterized protein